MRRYSLLPALAASLLSLALLSPIAPAQATPEAGDWTSTQSNYDNPRAVRPLVVNLRHATHPAYDRVVIDVDGRLPGYRMDFVRVLRQDGSGNRVRLPGKYKLRVDLYPAAAHSDRTGKSVYEGPRRETDLGYDALKGLALMGDFEGTVSFGFGTDKRVYRAFRLTNPNRIVIDFKH